METKITGQQIIQTLKDMSDGLSKSNFWLEKAQEDKLVLEQALLIALDESNQRVKLCKALAKENIKNKAEHEECRDCEKLTCTACLKSDELESEG